MKNKGNDTLPITGTESFVLYLNGKYITEGIMRAEEFDQGKTNDFGYFQNHYLADNISDAMIFSVSAMPDFILVRDYLNGRGFEFETHVVMSHEIVFDEATEGIYMGLYSQNHNGALLEFGRPKKAGIYLI